ncbi:MAG: serine hydrolase domain-containing protein [Gemmatimonadaceae bacterium]
MRLLIACLILASAPPLMLAQQRDLAAAADTVFTRWNSTHAPGCAVGVARDGRTLLARGYGMADLESGAPITAGTIFESGSVAKQFTAAAVVLLALDGKLSLDDRVTKYIPEMPEYDRPITIRHLLTHTSGLREWSNLVAHTGWPRGSRAHSQDDLLDVVFRQKSLNYPVGDHYSYTNSGYAIAMSLVERVSGQPFREFSRARIFAPLGMTSTQWRDDFTRLVPGRAQAYTMRDGQWHLAMPFESVVGPGGLLTTVGDWLVWNDALARGTLHPALADSLTRRMRLTGGREITYALGVSVSDYRGVPEISHSGSTAGYSTFLARYPTRDNLSIAVLCNSTAGAAGAYTRQLADRLITNFPAPPALDTTRADVSALASFAGIYRSARTGAPLAVTPDLFPRFRALPNGAYRLPNGTEWHFSRVGSTPRLAVVQPDGDTVRYAYALDKPWQPGRETLRDFEGQYRNDEVGVTYTLRLVGDSLRAFNRPGQSAALRPTYTDGFLRGGSAVWFERDRRGRVTTMHIGEARLWDLVLRRL